MTIADPHAIPESEHDCVEYLTEADHAWDGGDSDRAKDLYHSLWGSRFATPAATSHAAYRLGLIAMNDGDADLAVHYLSSSTEPGAADVLHSLTNATHDDPTPSPDVIPETVEQFNAWFVAGGQAAHANDWVLAQGLFVAAASATCESPGAIASAAYNAGVSAHHQGDNDTARLWLESALPNLSSEDEARHARDLLRQYGGAHVEADGDSPAAAQVAAGIQAYETGDAHAAKAALEAALHLEGPDDQKGRARYYLGAMAYQAGHYADARDHIEGCLATAPEPEHSWAEAALQWRWDEHQ